MTELRKWIGLVLAAVVLRVVPADADSSATNPFVGITLIQRSETTPRAVHLNIVLVDLAAPGISFKLTPPGGKRDTVRQTTLEFLEQEKAQIALNAHFFVPYPSAETDVDVVGLAASQGRIYSPFEPQPVTPGQADQSYAIVSYAPAFNIDPSNHVAVVHRDPAHPDGRHVLERVKLWTAFSGSAQIVRDGVKTIPAYAGASGGLTPAKGYEDLNSWYSLPRARTAAGVTADGKTLVLVTVDQANGSGGMSVGELAELLITDYRVSQALNLDGGGSTTLVMQDPATRLGRILNVPGDNPRGRAVGSNLAVFARRLESTGNRPAGTVLLRPLTGSLDSAIIVRQFHGNVGEVLPQGR